MNHLPAGKTIVVILLLLVAGPAAAQTTALQKGFVTPPDSVKPSIYWYWMSDNMSQEGVKKDIEAMVKVGIGRAFIGNIGYPKEEVPYGKVKLFSDEWWKVTRAAISTASVGAARAAMRRQSNVNGTGRAGVVPAILLVGPDKETEAEQFVAPIAAADQDSANPFTGKLRIAVEDRLVGNGWYLFADPNIRPALAYGYLQGQTGPKVEVKEGWSRLGTEFRCYTDFGCAPFDYRAAYRNPGE